MPGVESRHRRWGVRHVGQRQDQFGRQQQHDETKGKRRTQPIRATTSIIVRCAHLLSHTVPFTFRASPSLPSCRIGTQSTPVRLAAAGWRHCVRAAALRSTLQEAVHRPDGADVGGGPPDGVLRLAAPSQVMIRPGLRNNQQAACPPPGPALPAGIAQVDLVRPAPPWHRASGNLSAMGVTHHSVGMGGFRCSCARHAASAKPTPTRSAAIPPMYPHDPVWWGRTRVATSPR